MISYVALLRGINVGGHKQVAMEDLRDLLTRCGFVDPKSLLQSGNLIFSTKAGSEEQLEHTLESEAGRRLGLNTDFFIRSAEEWTALIRDNPFPREAAQDPGHLVVICLKSAPATRDVEALRTAIRGPELVGLKGRQLYVTFPDGIGHSRLTNALMEQKLGTRGTGRNWNTVLKIKELLASAFRGQQTSAACKSGQG